MDLATYLPIIVGVLLFCITFYIRSKARKGKADSLASASTAAESAKTPATAETRPDPIYGPVHIYFGSQTGTAQNFCKILSEEASKEGFEPQVVDLGDFHPELFKEVKIALFAIATHGEGEPTENSKTFDEFLLAEERTGSEFSHLKFSVFALGNKQYQFFCGQGKKVNQHLEKLGGSRVYKYGEGDDNESLEDDFNTWKEGLWAELKKIAEIQTIPSGSRPAATATSGSPFTLNISPDLKEVDVTQAIQDSKEYDFQAKQYVAASPTKILDIRELRQKTSDGSTLHVELDSASAGVTYKTAQNLAVYPENSSDIVTKAATVLGLNLDDIFEIVPNEASQGKYKHPFPSPISVKTYLTRFCDLQSALRKKQLKDLAQLCSNEDNKNKLLFLASNEGKAEYEVQINSAMKGLLDIIQEYDVKLSLQNLIQISNLILPRLYTIASSHRQNPGTIHLCVSLQSDRLPDGKSKMGLNSSFLQRRYQEGLANKAFGQVRIRSQESTFSLPTDNKIPIIMLGPGAGLAPFKGFMDEKRYLTQKGEENPYGEMALYFGCKGEEWDYIYREELIEHHKNQTIKNLYVAFSRAQEQKVYVQDLLQKNKEENIKLLFESNAVVYICGSMSMGRSIMSRLADLAASHYQIDAKEAQAKIEEMEKSKRIIKELWG